jgi:ATP-binding cassette subfamily C (CFTR/MRP) protein 4
MDSDKVLVMDAGKMVEFEHPYNLLKNQNGYLYKMVQQTGQATSDVLHSIAAKVRFIFYHIKKKIKILI